MLATLGLYIKILFGGHSKTIHLPHIPVSINPLNGKEAIGKAA